MVGGKISLIKSINFADVPACFCGSPGVDGVASAAVWGCWAVQEGVRLRRSGVCSAGCEGPSWELWLAECVWQHLVKSFRQGAGITDVQINKVLQFVMQSSFAVWCNQSQIWCAAEGFGKVAEQPAAFPSVWVSIRRGQMCVIVKMLQTAWVRLTWHLSSDQPGVKFQS